ncbi:MAG: hypothetical protein OEZ36_04615, partial [Spirochaetota bacterium]|nr:hypothetical protein [Spirochaetota bacterium]
SPLYFAAGLETIRILLRENPYDEMRKLTEYFSKLMDKAQVDSVVLGSLFALRGSSVTNWYFAMLEEGFYMNPENTDCHYLSVSHTENDVKRLAKAVVRNLG